MSSALGSRGYGASASHAWVRRATVNANIRGKIEVSHGARLASNACIASAADAACDLAAQTVGPRCRTLLRWGSPLPHLLQDWAHPCHIYPGTGLAPGRRLINWHGRMHLLSEGAPRSRCCRCHCCFGCWRTLPSAMSLLRGPSRFRLLASAPTGSQRPYAFPATSRLFAFAAAAGGDRVLHMEARVSDPPSPSQPCIRCQPLCGCAVRVRP